MSAKQAAFLTSRVISLCFFYLALSTLVQIPAAFAFVSSLSFLSKRPGMDDYSTRLFAESSVFALKACVEIFLAMVFYRFGPRVAHFLLGDDGQIAPISVNPED